MTEFLSDLWYFENVFRLQPQFKRLFLHSQKDLQSGQGYTLLKLLHRFLCIYIGSVRNSLNPEETNAEINVLLKI